MIKRFLVLAAGILTAGTLSFAQDASQAAAAAAAALDKAPKAENTEKPNYWDRSTDINLGFNQTKLTNWAAGGFNTLSLSSALDSKANFSKNLMAWKNRLQLDYTFMRTSDKPGIFQKSNDRIYLESAWTYKTSKESKWNYSASYDLRSQFTTTPKKYVQDEDGKWKGDGVKSGFFAPGNMNIALGMEWVPTNWFNITFSPLTGSIVFCRIPELRKDYSMPLTADGVTYHSVLFQFGAQIKTNFKMTINDNLAYDTQLVLFSNYLDHPERLRINWDNKISWQAAKFIKVSFSTWLIYDPLILIDDTTKVQFKDTFMVSFAYTFKPRK